MKKYLLIILLFITPLFSFAQTLSPAMGNICLGDSLLLTLSGANGDTINWEMSINNNNWIPVTGVDSFYTTPSLIVPTYYRAGVSSMGNTTYSNSVFIQFHYVIILDGSSINGNILHLALGGSPTNSYSFSWSGAAIGSASTNWSGVYPISGLMPGLPITVYCAPVNAMACTSLYTFSPCLFLLSEIHTSATCGNNDGSIDLTVMPSTPSTYNWSNGETTEDLNNLSAGIYYVTTTDTFGCFLYQTVTILNSNGPVLTQTHTNSTCTAANGTIDLTVSGGTLPYTYLWSNGATTQDLLNIGGGNYSVTVVDQSGCNNFLIVTIVDSSYAYYPYISFVNPNCSNNGVLTAIMYGGQPPYNFIWSNGGTTQTISNLASGIYTLTVTDNLGCSTSVPYYSLPLTNSANVIEGRVFNDLNGNCIYDAGDTVIQGADIEVSSANFWNTLYASTDSNGMYLILVSDTGSYTVNIYTSPNCGIYSSCYSGSIYFPATCDSITNVDFVFAGLAAYDFEIFPFCYSGNPGFDKYYYLYAWDNSYPYYIDTVTTTFFYDTALIYNYSSGAQPIVDTINHTLTWKVVDVNLNGYFDCHFNVPASMPLTYLIHSEFLVTPTVIDCDTSNNLVVFDEPITSSFDPNSKAVFPQGNLSSADSILTYTIHFQNTGNDTTHFVILKDTLSQYLNPATVENITASAQFDFTISGSGILTWIFNPLFLPDSASNEAMSKGFVQFKVKVKQNLPNGALIENSASIYFDYNTPVFTNTTTNNFISGIHEINSVNDVTVFPNPAESQLTIHSMNLNMNSIEITDVLGRNIYAEKPNQKTSIINLKSFASGVYFIKAQLQDGSIQVKKFVKE